MECLMPCTLDRLAQLKLELADCNTLHDAHSAKIHIALESLPGEIICKEHTSRS